MKTPGAVSQVYVKLSSLTDVLQPNAMVLVSKKWAKMLGIQGYEHSENVVDIDSDAGNSQLQIRIEE